MGTTTAWKPRPLLLLLLLLLLLSASLVASQRPSCDATIGKTGSVPIADVAGYSGDVSHLGFGRSNTDDFLDVFAATSETFWAFSTTGARSYNASGYEPCGSATGGAQGQFLSFFDFADADRLTDILYSKSGHLYYCVTSGEQQAIPLTSTPPPVYLLHAGPLCAMHGDSVYNDIPAVRVNSASIHTFSAVDVDGTSLGLTIWDGQLTSNTLIRGCGHFIGATSTSSQLLVRVSTHAKVYQYTAGDSWSQGVVVNNAFTSNTNGHLLIGDFNNDAYDDFVFIDGVDDGVVQFLSTGIDFLSSSVQSVASADWTGTDVRGAVGDIDGNQCDDLVLCHTMACVYYPGSPDGGLSAPAIPLIQASPSLDPPVPAVGDVDGDGVADLAVAYPSTQSIQVIYGDGNCPGDDDDNGPSDTPIWPLLPWLTPTIILAASLGVVSVSALVAVAAVRRRSASHAAYTKTMSLPSDAASASSPTAEGGGGAAASAGTRRNNRSRGRKSAKRDVYVKSMGLSVTGDP